MGAVRRDRQSARVGGGIDSVVEELGMSLQMVAVLQPYALVVEVVAERPEVATHGSLDDCPTQDRTNGGPTIVHGTSEDRSLFWHMESFLRQTVPGRSEISVPLLTSRNDDADGFGMRLARTSAGPFGITLSPDALA